MTFVIFSYENSQKAHNCQPYIRHCCVLSIISYIFSAYFLYNTTLILLTHVHIAVLQHQLKTFFARICSAPSLLVCFAPVYHSLGWLLAVDTFTGNLFLLEWNTTGCNTGFFL